MNKLKRLNESVHYHTATTAHLNEVVMNEEHAIFRHILRIHCFSRVQSVYTAFSITCENNDKERFAISELLANKTWPR